MAVGGVVDPRRAGRSGSTAASCGRSGTTLATSASGNASEMCRSERIDHSVASLRRIAAAFSRTSIGIGQDHREQPVGPDQIALALSRIGTADRSPTGRTRAHVEAVFGGDIGRVADHRVESAFG